MCLCDRHQVKQHRDLWPLPLAPAWPVGFESSSPCWLEKLNMVLLEAQRPTVGIDHCVKLVRHEPPEFLPSGVSLAGQLTKMRNGEAPAPLSSGPQMDFERFGCTLPGPRFSERAAQKYGLCATLTPSPKTSVRYGEKRSSEFADHACVPRSSNRVSPNCDETVGALNPATHNS